MSQREDGKFVCDRCGGDCGNGSVFNCLVVADVTPDAMVLNLHFCRAEGCASALLSPENLAGRMRAGLSLGSATPEEDRDGAGRGPAAVGDAAEAAGDHG